jgi:hypothetical protein
VPEDRARDADSSGTAVAREKYHCPACGADAHWNPGKQALVCPFCGTESSATLQKRGTQTVIVEHDLVAALRAIPDEARGWKANKLSVRCQSCRAISVFDEGKVGKRCDFCGSAQLVPYSEVKDAFRPESLLPLKISEADARERIRAWYGKLWLAPNRLKRRALTDTAKGVYLPFWSFDADTHASWTAESGTYYYTQHKGKRVQHVRWRHVSGELSHVFDDLLVPASAGIGSEWLHKVEPFPTVEAIPYDPGYLAGWTVERYQIDLVRAASLSRQRMEAHLRDLCARQVPGDTHRNLVVRPTFSNQKFKHLLAPIWLLTYNYGAQSYQVVVNGVTGSIAGGRPWSWIKIGLLILLAIIIFMIITWANN